MTAAGFWAAIRDEGLRPEDPPSWVTGNLRSRVSVAAFLIPAAPDPVDGRDDEGEA